LIQKTCETGIDLAMHLVRKAALGIRRTAATLSICSPKQANWMPPRRRAEADGRFSRNIAVRDNSASISNLLRAIVEHYLVETWRFAEHVVRTSSG
jgi:hypothetical protein